MEPPPARLPAHEAGSREPLDRGVGLEGPFHRPEQRRIFRARHHGARERTHALEGARPHQIPDAAPPRLQGHLALARAEERIAVRAIPLAVRRPHLGLGPAAALVRVSLHPRRRALGHQLVEGISSLALPDQQPRVPANPGCASSIPSSPGLSPSRVLSTPPPMAARSDSQSFTLTSDPEWDALRNTTGGMNPPSPENSPPSSSPDTNGFASLPS